MIKKIIILAAFCLSTSSVMAQEVYPYKWGGGIEFNAGSGAAFGATFRGQYYINKYLTWDMLQFRAYSEINNRIDSHDWSEEFSLTTGLRAYTPTFGPGLKAFAAGGVGYGFYHTYDKPEKWWGSPRWKTDFYSSTHNLSADLSAGLFVWQGVYVSYGCQIFHNNSRGNHIDHLFNIGFELGSFKFKD